MLRNAKRILLTSIAIAIVTPSAIAMTGLGTMPLPQGWYAEGNYGLTKSTGKSYPTHTNKNSGTGWNVNAGYKFMPYVGIEAGYTRYAATRLQNTAGTTAAHDNHQAVDLAVKGIAPLGCSGVELFGKLGINRISSKISGVNASAAAVNSLTFDTRGKNSTGLYLAAGAQATFTPYIQANLQWAQAYGNNSTGNQALYSLGISYILG